MNTDTQIIEIDFENFLTLFYKVNSSDSELEKKFIDSISELERRIQDLDLLKSEEAIHLRNFIIIKLKYWEKIITDGMEYFNDELAKSTIINSIIYCFSFLSQKSLAAIETGNVDTVYREIERVYPNPDEYFVTSSGDDSIPITLNFILLLIKKFLDNYVLRKLSVDYPPITKKEIDFLNHLKMDIEKYPDFDLVFENYITENIRSAYITELPVFIYLESLDEKEIINYYEAVKKLLDSLNIELLYEYDAKKGSWIKKAISRIKSFFTSDEFIDRLKKLEHGIELNTINKTQSEIDKNQAEALAAVMTASANIPKLCTLIGSLLIVKTLNENNEPILFCRALQTNELIYLKENPKLLQTPNLILKQLESYNAGQTEKQKLLEG